MAASQAGLFSIQEFTDGGVPLVGGRVYTYTYGTTTFKTAYTDAAATVPHTYTSDGIGGQYIGLNARGELPAPLYLTSGSYDITLKRADGSTVWTRRADPVADAAATAAAAVLAQLASYTTGQGASLVAEVLKDGSTQSSVHGAILEMRQDIALLSTSDNDNLQSIATDLAAGTTVGVACFGDSTMWGADPANLNGQVPLPPPSQLQNFINTYFGNTACSVTNFGVSGTTMTQMIAGTDGSGSTFAAKMASSTARLVYCNHGVNDAFGANATTLAAYQTAILAFITACRSNNKTPVLVTPFPTLTIGTFGSQARVEATARFAQAMRSTAMKHGVKLVDQHRWMSMLLQVDGNLPLAVFPDGVHAAAVTYQRAGNNLAEAILGAQAGIFMRSGQRIPASSSAIRASGQTINASTASREGVVTTTGTTSPQSLRVVFRVDETGLDVSMLHSIWGSGSNAIAINLDGIPVFSNFSMSSANFTSSFWQDFETQVARNIPPGFHVLILTTSSSGAIGLSGLRSRNSIKPLLLPNAGNTPIGSRQTLAARLDVTAAIADAMFVSDDAPVSRILDDLEFEFTAQLLKTGSGSGVIIGGNIGSNSGSASCERALVVGINASGFLFFQEATAPGTYTAATVLGAVDLSTASHVYRVKITAASPGQISLFVDDAQIGATTNLTQPYYGGLLGVWRNASSGTLAVTGISRIWRQ